jgi:molybdate transport system substrate-binding protein
MITERISYHIVPPLQGGMGPINRMNRAGMNAMAAKLKVLCARSMTKAVEKLAADFSHDSANNTDITFGTVGALEAKLAAGETADVLILSSSAIAKLDRAGALVSDGRTDIARTSIGVAVREGSPAPDIATAEAFRKTLLAAHAVAFSDAAVGGSAGVYLADLFQRMGIADDIARNAMPQKTGGEVASRVAEGNADLGLTLIAEIVPITGARVIGKLPPPLGNDTTYTGAVSATCTDRAAAAAFIATLASPATRDVWQAAGFELPDRA